MGFWNFFKAKKESPASAKTVVHVRDDDYCQIEILHVDNVSFLKEQIDISREFSEAHKAENGFTDIWVRNANPVLTISKEIREDYFVQALSLHKVPKHENIQIDYGLAESMRVGKINAYGFENFSLVFEIDGEYVKHIWITNEGALSGTELDIITSALYYLGEENSFILIDWNSDDLIDLTNKGQIHNYLK